MATDLAKNNIPNFLGTFLSKPASAIPKGSQWIVTFETEEPGTLKSRILPAIQLAYAYEPHGADWKTALAAQAILTDEYQSSRGCLFCQAIGLPGEGQTVNPGGNIQSNAFIRPYVGAGRNDFPQMRMTFLDTNVSFCDSFLRGWALATANFGLAAVPREDSRNYRTDIWCYKIGIGPEKPFILMTMKFKDACCISVSEEEYSYAPATNAVMREARFIFNSYSVDTQTGNQPEIYENTLDPTQFSNPYGLENYGQQPFEPNLTNPFQGPAPSIATGQ